MSNEKRTLVSPELTNVKLGVTQDTINKIVNTDMTNIKTAFDQAVADIDTALNETSLNAKAISTNTTNIGNISNTKISLAGDATGEATLGMTGAEKTINVVLADTNVTPGTYAKVTVDKKGRVTGTDKLAAADIPSMTNPGQIMYQNETAVIKSIGGIEAGQTFAKAMPITQVIDKLLYPYVAPTVKITTTPGDATREKGDTVSVTKIDCTVTKGSRDIKSIEVFKDGKSIGKQEGSGLSYSLERTDEIKEDTTYSVEVHDVEKTGVAAKQSIAHKFIYPCYWGIVNTTENETAPEMDSKTIVGLNKIISSNISSLTVTLENQHLVLAIPGEITYKSILDKNNFENIAAFEKRPSVQVTGRDGTAQKYTVYIMYKPATCANFTYTFK